MKKIKTKDFWDTVRKHLDEAGRERMFAPFREAKELQVDNPFKLPAELLERLILSQAQGAKINGCRCEEDVEFYFHEVYRIAKETFGSEAQWGTIKALPRMLKYLWKLASLGRSRGENRRCHMSRKYVICLGEEFVCYCDEHAH